MPCGVSPCPPRRRWCRSSGRGYRTRGRRRCLCRRTSARQRHQRRPGPARTAPRRPPAPLTISATSSCCSLRGQRVTGRTGNHGQRRAGQGRAAQPPPAPGPASPLPHRAAGGRSPRLSPFAGGGAGHGGGVGVLRGHGGSGPLPRTPTRRFAGLDSARPAPGTARSDPGSQPRFLCLPFRPAPALRLNVSNSRRLHQSACSSAPANQSDTDENAAAKKTAGGPGRGGAAHAQKTPTHPSLSEPLKGQPSPPAGVETGAKQRLLLRGRGRV